MIEAIIILLCYAYKLNKNGRYKIHSRKHVHVHRRIKIEPKLSVIIASGMPVHIKFWCCCATRDYDVATSLYDAHAHTYFLYAGN